MPQVHAFFSDFCPRPVHVIVDVSLATPRVPVSVYVAAANPLANKTLFVFSQLPLRLALSVEARVGLDAMTRPAHGREGGAGGGRELGAPSAAAAAVSDVRDVASDLEALEASMR